MQLGTRWGVGSPPHPSVPSALHEAIEAQEDRFPDAGAWTLTWLEGRPRCELDDEVLVTIDTGGRVSVNELRKESGNGGSGDDSDQPDDPDDSDDDWLK